MPLFSLRSMWFPGRSFFGAAGLFLFLKRQALRRRPLQAYEVVFSEPMDAFWERYPVQQRNFLFRDQLSRYVVSTVRERSDKPLVARRGVEYVYASNKKEEFSFLRNYSTSSDFLCKDIRGNLSYYNEVKLESFARGNWVNENSLPRAQRGDLK